MDTQLWTNHRITLEGSSEDSILWKFELRFLPNKQNEELANMTLTWYLVLGTK
jgi:hypothetical protein